jgi:hypothetical protein
MLAIVVVSLPRYQLLICPQILEEARTDFGLLYFPSYSNYLSLMVQLCVVKWLYYSTLH